MFNTHLGGDHSDHSIGALGGRMAGMGQPQGYVRHREDVFFLVRQVGATQRSDAHTWHYGHVRYVVLKVAPAGGTAAAAPEEGALAGPSAPTSTSTRWAMVTP
jgi:hypothetical protein